MRVVLVHCRASTRPFCTPESVGVGMLKGDRRGFKQEAETRRCEGDGPLDRYTTYFG